MKIATWNAHAYEFRALDALGLPYKRVGYAGLCVSDHAIAGIYGATPDMLWADSKDEYERLMKGLTRLKNNLARVDRSEQA